MSIKIDVSYGELLDKITILEIKSERIEDSAKLDNIRRELDTLNDSWSASALDDASIANDRAALKKINETLWEIEDAIRDLEAQKSFGTEFVDLARRVYQTNDERSRVKRQINDTLGSALTEEKSYQPY